MTRSPDQRAKLGILYKWEWTDPEYGEPRKVPKISCENLKRIANLAASEHAPIPPSKQMVEYLDKTIAGRQELREWHDRLPPDDERFQYNRNHQAIVNTLVEVRSLLIEKGNLTNASHANIMSAENRLAQQSCQRSLRS